MKRKLVLRPFVLPTIYITLIVGLMMFTAKALYKDPEPVIDNTEMVNEEIFENVIPVVNDDVTVISPYKGEEVEEKIGYYDFKADKKEQEKSIIQYDNTYLQNTGITYSSKKEFEVVAILDGTVTKIYDNELLGNIVEITHKNGLVSVYQMVKDINVKEKDEVKMGDTIAKSGTSKIETKNNNLHFEVIKDGITVNPKTIIGTNTKEL